MRWEIECAELLSRGHYFSVTVSGHIPTACVGGYFKYFAIRLCCVIYFARLVGYGYDDPDVVEVDDFLGFVSVHCSLVYVECRWVLRSKATFIAFELHMFSIMSPFNMCSQIKERIPFLRAKGAPPEGGRLVGFFVRTLKLFHLIEGLFPVVVTVMRSMTEKVPCTSGQMWHLRISG